MFHWGYLYVNCGGNNVLSFPYIISHIIEENQVDIKYNIMCYKNCSSLYVPVSGVKR